MVNAFPFSRHLRPVQEKAFSLANLGCPSTSRTVKRSIGSVKRAHMSLFKVGFSGVPKTISVLVATLQAGFGDVSGVGFGIQGFRAGEQQVPTERSHACLQTGWGACSAAGQGFGAEEMLARVSVSALPHGPPDACPRPNASAAARPSSRPSGLGTRGRARSQPGSRCPG